MFNRSQNIQMAITKKIKFCDNTMNIIDAIMNQADKLSKEDILDHLRILVNQETAMNLECAELLKK